MDPSIYLTAPLQLDKICRACLSERGDMRPLYGACLDEMLVSFATIQVHEEDGLPNLMCVQCVLQCSRAYTFKQLCERSDNILRHYVSPEFQEQLRSLQVEQIKDDQTEIQFVGATLVGDEIPAELVNVSVAEDGTYKIEVSSDIYTMNISTDASQLVEDKDDSVLEDEKPPKSKYHCIKCDASFPLKVDLKVHMMGHPKELSHVCAVCNKGFSEARILKRHLKIHLEKKPECDSCGIIFQSDADLNSHTCEEMENDCNLKNEIDQEPAFKCPLCSKNHSNLVSLSIHFLKHALLLDTSTELFFCEICGQIFDSNVLLEEHYQEHVCVKEIWICSICNILFETETLLLLHNNSHDNSEANSIVLEKISCILCEESFLTKDNLATHTLTHLFKRYMCKECSVSFCTQQAYFQHLKLHPRYQYTCIICGQLLKTKNSLKCHVIGVHSEDPAYICNVCNKSFKTPGRLKTHSHIHEEHKNFMCSYCGYATHKSGDLQIHIRSHTSERPYRCTFGNCTMKFKTSSHLCSHQRRHLNIRNFACTLCNASFGTRHSLKLHHMLHTGEKPYTCTTCGQRFRRKYHLKLHQKQHGPKS